jgi:ubiquinone/menaquinone biosynthesis C-methylase UbiE
MTFFIKPDAVQPDAGKLEQLGLSQRARAGMEILGAMQRVSSTRLRDAAQAAFEADFQPEGDADLGAAVARAREAAHRLPVFHLERFVQRYVAEENFVRGIPAVEERRAVFEQVFVAPNAKAGGSVELDPGLERPGYWENNWHLEPGGWDGYDLYGPMMAYAVGPHVFRYGGQAYVHPGEDIRKQRQEVVRQFPKKSYGRILELGCGSGTTLFALHREHPEAELTGLDASTNLLTMGHLAAEKMGIPVHFKQRDIEHCGEPDGAYDGVLCFAIHHEMPPEAGANALKEAFRVLKPGGDLVVSDVPPFREVSPFLRVLLDWETKNRGEPYFSSHCAMDWGQVLREIGFEDVEAYAVGNHSYPWITRGRKPA